MATAEELAATALRLAQEAYDELAAAVGDRATVEEVLRAGQLLSEAAAQGEDDLRVKWPRQAAKSLLFGMSGEVMKRTAP
jgi:hypothetical protein